MFLHTYSKLALWNINININFVNLNNTHKFFSHLIFVIKRNVYLKTAYTTFMKRIVLNSPPIKNKRNNKMLKKLNSNNQNNIVLTGGGTGGHVIPNLCLIPHLKKHFNIYYIGSNLIEKDIISKEKDVTFKQISTPPKLNRNKFFKNFLLPFTLIKCIHQCKKLLQEIQPKLVFSKGGFVSVPVCLAAKILNIPVISHESDLSLGTANKIIYKISKKFLTTFQKTALPLKKAVATGSPIRDSLFSGNPQKALEQSNLSLNYPTILIMGGSTGAKNLNESVYKILPKLTQKYNVIHIVGKNKGNKKINYKNYYQTEFVYNIQDYLALSDMVISRAGSNAICELLALKKPMILVPLSNSASRGDQVDNAKYFESLGICLILNESTLTSEEFLNKINLLNKKKNSFITKMNSLPSINGTQNIVNEILNYK